MVSIMNVRQARSPIRERRVVLGRIFSQRNRMYRLFKINKFRFSGDYIIKSGQE